LIGFVAALVVGGCGVPASDNASTAKGTDVPFGLLDATPSSTTSLPELSSTTVRVWLVAGERIAPVARDIVAPPRLDRALSALAVGPTEPEATLGLRSAVAAETIGETDLVSGVATVDLRKAFANSTPREQLLALAQLVYTATEVDAVEVVSFTFDGQPIDVPRDDGSISDGPVTRLDYADLAS
jgi:hypothetical protein